MPEPPAWKPDRLQPDLDSGTVEHAEMQGRLGMARNAERISQALLKRPRFSLRLQIALGYLLTFIIALAIVTALVFSFQRMESKIRFLEIVNDYVMQVEQARRFEKNYFLYGTNLSDAQDNVLMAKKILTRNDGELAAILGPDWRLEMLPNLERYQGGLERLNQAGKKSERVAPNLNSDLEDEVRTQGQQMVSAALALLSKEKAALARVMQNSRQMLFYAVALLLLLMVFNTYLLGRRMLNSIKRFETYARRIASGDYTPVTPIRRYRDEFTALALALNSMIEELQKREAVLVQSHKMRAVGTLTAGVAHELNNPLNNITLTAHVLQEDYESLNDAERREMVGDVVNEASRAKKIISNLLDFARESGSQLEPLDLTQLLHETIALVHNQTKLTGIKIDFQAPETLPKVHGDSQQLRQVFLNLILNAIDASPKGSAIQVQLQRAEQRNYLAVKVIDSGSGIPSHILPSIFDPFFTTKSKGKGTGLGLSVSHGIVAKHGGRIKVNSEEGQGATFNVLLPITAIPAELSAKG
jgi:two-component system NtrC family sensor kinase